jgi:Zn-dependent peptidase ImmA (M78 family)
MNSSLSKGDDLEDKVYDYLRREIEEDRFLVRSRYCRIYQKKGYYSKDREKNIIFDVSIEVFYPDQKDYSIVFLIECKNYGGPVKVDDLEEFHAKKEQVASANSKAILITSNSFQGGARKYAKSKGIGLARFTDPQELKWELMRSPSSIATSTHQTVSSEIESSLAFESTRARYFDFVFESPTRTSNSLWDFFEDLIQEMESDSDQVDAILNGRSKLDPLVPYITREQIEDFSADVAARIGYEDAAIDLEEIARSVPGLKIRHSTATDQLTLGVASFDLNEITLFQDDDQNRRRFTLAHELSHFLLDHGKFMRRDTCDETDLTALKSSPYLPREVRRMEYQANLLASCLLMPRKSFIRSFVKIAKTLELQDRGFGYIYYDEQPCNARDFMLVTSSLMKTYSVSRTAARIRLETLGFITNAQAARNQGHPPIR